MANRASAKSKAKAYTKSKKKGAMDGMTVKGGHKLPTSKGAGLTAKGRASINRRTGSNLKAPAPNPKTKKDQLGKPGHIFPLKAREGGVLRRAGHTEASIDLARLAGLEPAGVIVEILNEDGSMARTQELHLIAQKFNLKFITEFLI